MAEHVLTLVQLTFVHVRLGIRVQTVRLLHAVVHLVRTAEHVQTMRMALILARVLPDIQVPTVK